jgi:hypothetical protein
MSTTQFKYEIDLAEFVSDYCRIDRRANSVEIAEAYIDRALPAEIQPSKEELDAEVNRLAEAINYYR